MGAQLEAPPMLHLLTVHSGLEMRALRTLPVSFTCPPRQSLSSRSQNGVQHLPRMPSSGGRGAGAPLTLPLGLPSKQVTGDPYRAE